MYLIVWRRLDGNNIFDWSIDVLRRHVCKYLQILGDHLKGVLAGLMAFILSITSYDEVVWCNYVRDLPIDRIYHSKNSRSLSLNRSKHPLKRSSSIWKCLQIWQVSCFIDCKKRHLYLIRVVLLRNVLSLRQTWSRARWPYLQVPF
jgi:hypothetical protein